MEFLLEFQDSLLRSVTNNFRRYLHREINWQQRMIGIKGLRGTGKTTVMLQHLKFDLNGVTEALYVTADHPWFYNHTLLETATDWYKQGGRLLCIDEVHKYPRWSSELKNIYDGLPELRVVFSASSALDIYRGEADLSRRVFSYSLAGLSFREYLAFTAGESFGSIPLADIATHHRAFAQAVLGQLQPLPHFKKYLKNGYLPIIAEGESEYLPRLAQIINAIVETDLAYTANYNAGTAIKVKKLLGVIAESVPFKPNVSALSRKLDLSRDSVYQYIYQLRDARLLNTLSVEGKGAATLQKPDKIYLENANLAYALRSEPNVGNLRETFLLGQLLNKGFEVKAPDSGDFLVEEVTIEVGGRSKTSAQVQDITNHLVASDDLEVGFGKKVPLWMFGFLY